MQSVLRVCRLNRPVSCKRCSKYAFATYHWGCAGLPVCERRWCHWSYSWCGLFAAQSLSPWIFLLFSSLCCVCPCSFYQSRCWRGASGVFRIVGLWLSCEIAFYRAVVPWHHPPASRRLTSLICIFVMIQNLNPHACPASDGRVKHIRLGKSTDAPSCHMPLFVL